MFLKKYEDSSKQPLFLPFFLSFWVIVNGSLKCLFNSVMQVAPVRHRYLISPHQMRVVVTAEWDRFERAGGTSDQRGRSEITTHLEIFFFVLFLSCLSPSLSLSLPFFSEWHCAVCERNPFKQEASGAVERRGRYPESFEDGLSPPSK